MRKDRRPLRRGQLRGRRTRSHAVDRPHDKLIRGAIEQTRNRTVARRAAPRHRRPIRPAMTRIGHPPPNLIPLNQRTVGSRRRPTQHHLTIPSRRHKMRRHTRQSRWRGRRRVGRSHHSTPVVHRLHFKLIGYAIGQTPNRTVACRAASRHSRPTRPVLTRIGHPLPNLIPRNRRGVGRDRPLQRHLTVSPRRGKPQRNHRPLRRGRCRGRFTGSHAVDRPHGKLIRSAIEQPYYRRLARGAASPHGSPSPIRPSLLRIGLIGLPPLNLIPRNRRAVGGGGTPLQDHMTHPRRHLKMRWHTRQSRLHCIGRSACGGLVGAIRVVIFDRRPQLIAHIARRRRVGGNRRLWLRGGARRVDPRVRWTRPTLPLPRRAGDASAAVGQLCRQLSAHPRRRRRQ